MHGRSAGAPVGVFASCLLVACGGAQPPAEEEPLGALPNVSTSAEPQWLPQRPLAGHEHPADPRERHFDDLRQVTFEGTYAHPSWSPDGQYALVEVIPRGASCHEVTLLRLSDGRSTRLSAKGADARGGAFIGPTGARVVFATSAPSPSGECVDRGQRELDLTSVGRDGSDPRPIAPAPGLDLDPQVTPDGTSLTFVSARDGDLELYRGSMTGDDLRRITTVAGPDAEVSLAPDASKIVWAASRPGGDALEVYRDALERGLVDQATSALWVASPTGDNSRRVTGDDARYATPTFLPDSRHVLFSSNVDDPSRGREGFDLYLVDPDGPPTARGTAALERVTFHDGFDGEPAVSPDGKYILFVSDRGAERHGEANLFVARWVQDPE